MGKMWKWVLLICFCLLLLGAALVGVAYATGGSVERVLVTTDIADMTKFMSREQILHLHRRGRGRISDPHIDPDHALAAGTHPDPGGVCVHCRIAFV